MLGVAPHANVRANGTIVFRGIGMLVEELGWLQPVLIAAAVVFVLDLIGNMISFSNRVLNALTTAIVFAVLFSALIHLGIVRLDVTAVPTDAAAETTAPVTTP